MRIPKRTAMGVSGLIFAGTAIIGLGAATPASADGRWGCCGRSHHRHHSLAGVHNRNFNFSRSHSLEAQRAHQRQFHFDHKNDFFHENREREMEKKEPKW